MTPVCHKKSNINCTDPSSWFTSINKICMHKNFLNTLWEITRGVEEDRDSFMQNILNMRKICKVKSPKYPSSIFHQRRRIKVLLQRYASEKKRKKVPLFPSQVLSC